MKFYRIEDQIVIGGDQGEEVVPNTTDGAYEKHVPVIEHHSDSVVVHVGSVAHPMQDVHYIEWIVLETATGYQKKDLKPGDAPEASFAVTEPVVAAYEYCNLHGLWKVAL
jgi:superoxide reductase